jgi:epoxyqueuosine reductase
VKSGVGWLGKNGNLISKKRGSFFFLAEILIDVKLNADGLVTDHCGTCTACIDACPTDAIIAPMQVDGSKCISYFTIELKEQIPEEWRGKWTEWAFGCDVCQDVCPWNRFSKTHNEERFLPKVYWEQLSASDWLVMEEVDFKKMVKGTPLERAKWAGFQRNLKHLKRDL